MSAQSVVRVEAVEVAASSVIYQEVVAAKVPLQSATDSLWLFVWLEISEHHVANVLFDLKWPSARGSHFYCGRSRFIPGCLLQLSMHHRTEPHKTETED